MTNQREYINATIRLMRYADKALTAKYLLDPVAYADLRTSTDDCRIAIRAATGEPLELPHERRRHE